MDHHCWWTNNCVGYGTFKAFVLFGIYISLQLLFGVATILHHFCTTNIEHGNGIQGLLGVFRHLFNFNNIVGLMSFSVVNPWGYFDLFLLQFLIIMMGLAAAMTIGVVFYVMKNESQVDAAKAIEE